MTDTVESIAQEVIRLLSTEDRQAIANDFADFEPMPRVWAKSSVCRWIRNEFGLWYTNPLTEEWRSWPDNRDIRDGVDYSKDHPDNISDTIYNRVVEILNSQ